MRLTLTEAIAKAVEAIGAGAAIKSQVIDPAVADIIGVVARLKREQNIDVEDLLNGDPVHDRTIIAGAALEGELTAAIDWSAVADEAFTVAFTVLKAASGLMALL